MPELRRETAGALATGMLLAVLTGFGGVIAALAAWLAQPALALAVSWWQGSRGRPAFDVAGRKALAREAGVLLALWGGGLALAALLIAWPLTGLRQSGSLGAAIGLSLVAGVIWLGLWRTWPVWRAIERKGGDLRDRWQRLDEVQIGISSGWRPASLVAAMLAAALVLAWPGLLAPAARWIAAALYALALPALHVLLQRTQAPPLAVIEELPHDEDEGNKGSQATNAGADPMDHFKPQGDFPILLGCHERGQHQAERETDGNPHRQNHQPGPIHGGPQRRIRGRLATWAVVAPGIVGRCRSLRLQLCG